MATSALQPNFARVSAQDKIDYDRFFEYTNDANIQSYASGAFLANLATLAERTRSVIDRTNPLKRVDVLHEGPQGYIRMMQWELDRISEVKERLGKAIECKRAYYDNHFFGIITKYVLKCFGMWNDGDTADIQSAEDFLIKYDSRLPMEKDSKGCYRVRDFFFGGGALVSTVDYGEIELLKVSAAWIRGNLRTARFYTYNPRREIPGVQNFKYENLDRRNPTVFIREMSQTT